MGARKRSKKKANPDRHKAFMRIRKEATHDFFTDKNHNEMVINPMKRFLLGKEYINPELRAEVLRRIAKYSVGEEKYNQIATKGA